VASTATFGTTSKSKSEKAVDPQGDFNIPTFKATNHLDPNMLLSIFGKYNFASIALLGRALEEHFSHSDPSFCYYLMAQQ
jgi:hypothetical protein